ncbi:hypothetical protein ACVU7I_13575, partial [Patulibacter sp. S7RM1-6]
MSVAMGRSARTAAGVTAALLVALAVLCLLGLHAACTTDVPPPLSRAPAPGTPRAAYCDALDTGGARTGVLALCVLVGA